MAIDGTMDVEKERKFSPEFACGVLFYLALLAQLAVAVAIFLGKNSEMPTFDADGKPLCPDGYLHIRNDCKGYDTNKLYLFSGDLCITEALCEDLKTTCNSLSRRLDTESPRILALTNEKPEKDVWDFLEKHFYQPLVLFSAVFVLAGFWLILMEKFPRCVVWGTIVADCALCLAMVVWFYIEDESFNVPALVLAVAIVIGAFCCRKQIETACVIMKIAMQGLFEMKRLFVVTFAVQLLWVGYFAIWIASTIGTHFIKEAGIKEATNDAEKFLVGSGKCEVRTGWATSVGVQIFWVLMYYWVTAFAKNINTMMITATLGGWYFEEEDYGSFWLKGLKWSLGVQSGGNALCAAITGFLNYVLAKTGGVVKIIFALLNPIDWIFICLACCLANVAKTFTKFGLIAMTFSGQGFCATAPDAYRTLKSRLGDAVVTDYIGKRIMSWVTYVLAVGIAFAAWAWADQSQGMSNLSELGMAGIIGITIFFVIFVAYPLVGLIFVVVIEQLMASFGFLDFENKDLWGVRAIINSVLAALFMGCITQFILTFVSEVVVTAMDVILFCFAIDESSKGSRFEGFQENVEKAFPEAIKEESNSEGTENNRFGIPTQTI
jgi:hypothetical protein